jgi:hypothetical protein
LAYSVKSSSAHGTFVFIAAIVTDDSYLFNSLFISLSVRDFR